MKVLVIGGGGREHALAWKLAASPKVQCVYVAPGNGGTALDPRLENVPISEPLELAEFAQRESVALTVVGPEAPLAAGVVDLFRARELRIFGPTRAAAQLESSKAFCKAFMQRHGIPTARWASFGDAAAAHAYVAQQGAPIVVKADGLAAGKGVTVARAVGEAQQAIRDALLGGRFGQSGSSVVVEEFLEGEIASYFALVDGAHALPLVTVQDHKAVGDGDTGPNTGGMGCYSPVPAMTEAMAEATLNRIVRPTVAAMAAEGRPYKGVLFTELMICRDGPKLIEFNVRFGDPECQVMMLRLKSDIVPALLAACDGELKSFDLRWHDDAALSVVIAAKGYPEKPVAGGPIRGIERAEALPGVTVFHAGTKNDSQGRLVAAGGRVLNVTARSATVAEAQALAYRAVDLIDFPDGFCRRDIGWRALRRG